MTPSFRLRHKRNARKAEADKRVRVGQPNLPVFEPNHNQPSPSLCAGFWYRLRILTLRPTHFWRQIKRLGDACENELFPAARNEGTDYVYLVPTEDPDGKPVIRIGQQRYSHACSHHVYQLLRHSGLQTIALDVKLESNQVVDILCFLHFHRQTIKKLISSQQIDAMPAEELETAALLTGEGVQFACTRMQLDPATGRLMVTYSYCQTPFSRAVRRFKAHSGKFKDHRAFFYSAPRYALAILAVTILPVILYETRVVPDHLIMILASTMAVAASVLIYLFFLSLGSIEYDNEVQAEHLNRAFKELKRYADRVRSDLNRAREIQLNLLPKFDRRSFGRQVSVVANFLPVNEVGGDYYDIKSLGDKKLAILFCDVSGHGLAAAFVTGLLKTFFDLVSGPQVSVGQFLESLNRQILQMTPDDSFAAAVYAIFDTEAMTLTYCNAGHFPMPLRLTHEDGQPVVQTLQEGAGPIIGVMDQASYKEAVVTFRAGDRLVLATDGIVEARNKDNEFFGVHRLQEVLIEHHHLDNQALLEKLLVTVQQFTQDRPQQDDQTTMLLAVSPEHAADVAHATPAQAHRKDH